MKPELHPACACFPPLAKKALKELADDIREKGLLEPVTLMPDGSLLDGRCRWDACEIVGIEPRTTTYTGSDPIGFVLSKNARRRNLSVTQMAISLGALAKLPRGRNWNKSGDLISGLDVNKSSVKNLSKQSGLAKATIQFGRTVVDKAEPHIIEMVKANAVNVKVAAEAVRHTPRDVQKTWTIEDVQRAGKEKIYNYPSNRKVRDHTKNDIAPVVVAAKPAPVPIKRVDIPYGTLTLPTAAEAGAPPPGSTVEEHAAFAEKYGRVALHPKTVADLYGCQERTNGLATRIVNMENQNNRQATETFFDDIYQMLAWTPQRGKTTGEEKDFAKVARTNLAILERHLPNLVERLMALRLRLEEYLIENDQNHVPTTNPAIN